jgi:hypothetical protein
MGILDRLQEKKRKMQEQIKKGRERTEQQKAERLRRKSKRLENMKPGTQKTIAEGLALKKRPTDVMREEYARRKRLREQRRNEKNKSS